MGVLINTASCIAKEYTNAVPHYLELESQSVDNGLGTSFLLKLHQAQLHL